MSNVKNNIMHQMDLAVQIFDTDCFGVMWHGAYTKWLEMGRVELLKSQGIELSKPDDHLRGKPVYIYPVTEQNFRFRSPARMADALILANEMTIEGYKLLFHQEFTQRDTEKVVMTAQTTCVVLNDQWRPLRTLPDFITDKFSPEL